MRYLNVLLFSSVFVLLTAPAGAADAPTFQFLDEECDRDFVVRAVVMVGKPPSSRAEARLAFHYQDADNLYFVHVAGGTVGLLKIQDGKPARLNPTVPFQPRADGSLVLTLKRHGTRMTLLVNGVIVARAQDATFSDGKIGTAAAGVTFTDVRYQPIEPVFFADDFTRAAEGTGEWEPLTGRWQLSSVRSNKFDPQATSNPFVLRALGGEMAVATAGRWFWDDYAVEAAVKADSDGTLGLMVFFQDGHNYLVFRWFSSAANVPPDKAKQLIRVVNGQSKVLDAKPGGFEPGQWYKLTVRADDEKVLTFVDDAPACAAENSFFGGGKIGLYAEFCRAAVFDDVLVKPWDGSEFPPFPFPDAPEVGEQFIQETSMAKWADPAAGWTPAGDGGAWHRGDFFGDAFMAVRTAGAGAPGTVMLCLHSPATDFHQGYTWRLQIVPQQQSARWELWRQGATVAQGTQRWEGVPAFIGATFFRSGQQVFGYLAGQRAFAFTDSVPLTGRKVGLYTQGIPVNFRDVHVGSTHLIDETFVNAPTRWWAGRGTWRVEPRWPCDERWAWFTGGNSETPTLWSKSAFEGDVTVELFAAVQMNSDKDPQGYFRPSDINVTLCGDGKDLGSGYSFIFAGWNNRRSAIVRQNQVVASNAEARMRQPVRTNLEFQRHWYHLRIEKRGALLRFFVDDRLVGQYHDPDPLPGRRVAFWTFKNGLVIARARIWYERTAPAPPFPPLVRFVAENPQRPPADPLKVSSPNGPVAHDFEGQLHGWTGRGRQEGARVSLDSATASRGRQSLRIQNTTSGGDFAVWTGVESLDIEKYPLLRFDYRLSSHVKVNLYVRINGYYFTILFTAGEQPTEVAPVLGSIPNVVADGQWHTAEFNLLTALRSRFPDAASAVVQGVAFACPDETYLRCGIGGNYRGSAFNVDNFQIQPAIQ